jgi:hypothetical protein
VQRWSLLSTHGRALLCIYRDPTVRLRDIAADLTITERRAYDVVNDLAEAGFVVKTRVGRRNHYEVQSSRPLTDLGGREQTVGEALTFLAGPRPNPRRRRAAD